MQLVDQAEESSAGGEREVTMEGLEAIIAR